MKRLPCKFQIGAVVYHRMEPDAGAGLVTEVRFTADGGVMFIVVWGVNATRTCYELELTTSRDWTTPEAHGGGTFTETQ